MDKTGGGDIGLELFYNFDAESLQLPVFALSSRFDLPQAPILKGWIPQVHHDQKLGGESSAPPPPPESELKP
jgi:hypothetical protein